MSEKKKANLSQWTQGRAAGRSLQYLHKKSGVWPKEGAEVPAGRYVPLGSRSANYLAGYAEGYKTLPAPRAKKVKAIAEPIAA
jgi:hypothetical protein